MRACNPKDVQYVSSRCCYSVCFDSNSHLSSFEVVSSIARIFALLLETSLRRKHAATKGLPLSLAAMLFQQTTTNTKQDLNDQLYEAVRKGDAAAVTSLLIEAPT